MCPWNETGKTRHHELFKVANAIKERLRKSALPIMVRLLNQQSKNMQLKYSSMLVVNFKNNNIITLLDINPTSPLSFSLIDKA